MLFDWDLLPSEAHTQKLRDKFLELITVDNYGFSEDSWNISMLMRGPGGKRIRAFQAVSGDRIDGQQRPDRALKKEGLPLRFRMKVLSRQACCKSADGKQIVNTESQYVYDKEDKILAAFEDKPELGDIVEWKGDTREPVGSPHLSTSHITDWAHRGERMHYYEKFTVDSDGCIAAPFSYALPMLMVKGFRVSGVRQFQRVDPPKQGEQPRRRITNWLFKEVGFDYVDEHRREEIEAERKKAETTAKRLATKAANKAAAEDAAAQESSSLTGEESGDGGGQE